MDVPYWWEGALLTLAAWRLFHLAALDDITQPLRRYVTRLAPTWKQEGDATGERYREKLAAFIECPYCLGFWISALVWLAWLVFPTETLWLSVPLALNAGLIGAQRVLSA